MPIFIQFKGLEGSVQTTTGHTEWVEISSMQWGIGRAITSGGYAQSDREGTLPSVGEVVVTKPTDSSSPGLYRHLQLGTKLQVSIISGKHPSKEPVFHTVNLTNAAITSILPFSSGPKRHEKIVIRFTEHTYNGIPNIRVPYNLFHI